MLFWLLALAGLVYLVILVALYLTQSRLLFPGAPPAPSPPVEAQTIVLESEGERLHGIFMPATRPETERPGILLLAFGGNVWNADAASVYLHEILPDADIVMFHYRGYPPSSGASSASALRADALEIHDALTRRFPGRPIIAAGFSLGSGVAAHLASQRDLEGVLLVTPFDSLWRVAGDHYPWLPVRLLFRHGMDAAADLRKTDIPVAVIAAEKDRLIVPARTEALRQAIPHLVFDRTISNTGHVDIYEEASFKRAMAEALERLRSARMK